MSSERYNSVEEFKKEFTGQWSPSDGLFLTLDFGYGDKGYILNTGTIYGNEPEKTANGEKAMFYFYEKRDKYESFDIDDKNPLCIYKNCFSTIDEAMENIEIDDKKFKDIILDYKFEIIEKS